jgi:hypothetical protein
MCCDGCACMCCDGCYVCVMRFVTCTYAFLSLCVCMCCDGCAVCFVMIVLYE